jgi:hypothetical protein
MQGKACCRKPIWSSISGAAGRVKSRVAELPRPVGNASALLPWPFRSLPRPGAGRLSQQKVFQDKLPFAGDEWSTANTACRFEIDDFRLCFCPDDLVQGIAVWAAEKRRFIRIRHERPRHFCLRAASIRARGRSKAGDLSQSASPQRCIALIDFRIRLRVRNTDHKTMVEKSTNDGSAIGGSCRSELRVIRLGHCHAA